MRRANSLDLIRVSVQWRLTHAVCIIFASVCVLLLILILPAASHRTLSADVRIVEMQFARAEPETAVTPGGQGRKFKST